MEAVVKNQGIVKIILKRKFPEYCQKKFVKTVLLNF